MEASTLSSQVPLIDHDNLFKVFYEFGSCRRSLNVIFLVLIPKKEGVEELKYFRPYKCGKWFIWLVD